MLCAYDTKENHLHVKGHMSIYIYIFVSLRDDCPYEAHAY